MKKGKLSLKDLAQILDGSWAHYEIIRGISQTDEYKKAIAEGIQLLADEKLQKIVKEHSIFSTIEEISEVLKEYGLPVEPATISYYIKTKSVPNKVTFTGDDLGLAFGSPQSLQDGKKDKGTTYSYYAGKTVYYINFIRFAFQVGRDRFNKIYEASFVSSPGRWLNDLMEKERDILNNLWHESGLWEEGDFNRIDSPLHFHQKLTEWLKPHVKTLCKDDKEKFDHYRHKFEEIENLQDLLLSRVESLKKDLSWEYPPNYELGEVN